MWIKYLSSGILRKTNSYSYYREIFLTNYLCVIFKSKVIYELLHTMIGKLPDLPLNIFREIYL